MRIDLKADRELIRRFGPLGYVSEQERNRILDLPHGHSKPAVKRLIKDIEDLKKAEKKRSK